MIRMVPRLATTGCGKSCVAEMCERFYSSRATYRGLLEACLDERAPIQAGPVGRGDRGRDSGWAPGQELGGALPEPAAAPVPLGPLLTAPLGGPGRASEEEFAPTGGRRAVAEAEGAGRLVRLQGDLAEVPGAGGRAAGRRRDGDGPDRKGHGPRRPGQLH